MKGKGVNRGSAELVLRAVPGCPNTEPFRYHDPEYEAVHLRRGGLWCRGNVTAAAVGGRCCTELHPVDWLASGQKDRSPATPVTTPTHAVLPNWNAPRNYGKPF